MKLFKGLNFPQNEGLALLFSFGMISSFVKFKIACDFHFYLFFFNPG